MFNNRRKRLGGIFFLTAVCVALAVAAVMMAVNIRLQDKERKQQIDEV